MYAELYDSSAVVFNSRQESRSTPNESFTLGLNEGDYNNVDYNNVDIGSLTGNLIPGQTYRVAYSLQSENFPAPATGVTASGFWV